MLLPTTALDRVLGDKTAKSFAKNLGLATVADLLQHYPRRYSNRGELTPIANLPIGESLSIVAEVVDARERRTKGRVSHILEVRITDGVDFYPSPFLIRPGDKKISSLASEVCLQEKLVSTKASFS
jgi:ATP-dependent DNA helicase RecG